MRNDAADDGLWVINKKRQAIYARAELPLCDPIAAAQKLQRPLKLVQQGNDVISEISDPPPALSLPYARDRP